MQLEQPIEGLWATPPAPLPFDQTISVRAFLLQRPAGNLVVYNAPGLDSAAGEIGDLGGATRQLLSHGHEAMFGARDLGAPVFLHEGDRSEAARSLPVAGTFAERQRIDDDFELIPIPGHTPGSTAFLWDSGSHRFLFSGDSVWIDHGEWSAVVLDPGARAGYLESLELLRGLEFDVLVPWGVTEGEPCIEAVERSAARERIGSIIARVEAGGDR